MRQSVLSLAAIVAFSLSAAHAQSTFQPNWSVWGSANLGMNVLARQQAVIHGRPGGIVRLTGGDATR